MLYGRKLQKPEMGSRPAFSSPRPVVLKAKTKQVAFEVKAKSTK